MGTAYWPTMYDYQEAVQTPSFCFSDAELRGGQPVLNKLGLPRPICGMFASVYELERRGRHWAARCFLRNIPDQQDRYAKISSHLAQSELPYFVTFEYLDEGIRVQGKWFPLIRMEWVGGSPLNEYVERNLKNPAALEALERNWLQLLKDLKGVQLAHGDLQHGNILVLDDGSLKLIDYDGMWVPALKGQSSHETGHPNYQSPRRTESDFHKDIDGFAGEVIQLAIRALVKKPELWAKYDNGDNLLFKRTDFVEPLKSPLFAELHGLGDRKAKGLVKSLVKACGGRGKPKTKKKKKAAPKPNAKAKPKPEPKPKAEKPKRVAKKPAPAKAKPKAKATPKPKPAPAGPAWLSDHVQTYAKPAAATATAAKPKKKSRKKKTRPAAAPATPAPAAAPSVPVIVRDPQRRLRVGLHVGVTLAAAGATALQLRPVLATGAGFGQALFIAACTVATVLGAVSLLMLYRLKQHHARAATWFYGLATATMLVRLAIDALSVGDLLRTCVLAVLVLACGGGLLLERMST